MEKSFINFRTLVIFSIYFVPDDVHRLLNIFVFESVYNPYYVWLDWPVSILYLMPFVFLVLCGNGILYNSRILKSVGFLIGLEILRCMFGSHVSLELYFSIIIAYASYKMLNKYEIKNFVFLFLFINILTIYLSFILGKSIVNSNGDVLYTYRYNAIGLDVGFSGVMCLLFVMMLDISRPKYFYFMLLVSIVGLFLTGSRISTLLLLFYYFLTYVRFSVKAGIQVFILTLLIVFFIINSNESFVQRYVELFQSFSNLNISFRDMNESSFVGRILSFVVGFEVLADNPWGVGFSIQNLQYAMNLHGYPTFPHSTLFVFLLMLGPALILVLLMNARVIKSLIMGNGNLLILVILIYNTIAGGAIVNPKIFFIYFLILSYSLNERRIHLRNNDLDMSNENNSQ